jgi:hypothetical protein
MMWVFLVMYTDLKRPLSWMSASHEAARVMEKGHHSGTYSVAQVWKWARTYICDRSLPVNPYKTWTHSQIDDEDLANDVLLHLQGIGRYVKAMDIVTFLQ